MERTISSLAALLVASGFLACSGEGVDDSGLTTKSTPPAPPSVAVPPATPPELTGTSVTPGQQPSVSSDPVAVPPPQLQPPPMLPPVVPPPDPVMVTPPANQEPPVGGSADQEPPVGGSADQEPPDVAGAAGMGTPPSMPGEGGAGGMASTGGAQNMAGASPGEMGGAAGEAANEGGAGGAEEEPKEPILNPGGTVDPKMGGFAAVAKYGVDTTTGGSAGPTVEVSSYDDLKKHAESNEVLVIKVNGTISAPGVHGLIKVQSNKTIIGSGGNAALSKITLSVNSWNRPGESCDADDEGSFTPASNVIIRNLEFKGLDKFPDDSKVDPDGIRVECFSHHVWIDHNTFRYGADGATDVKRGADMVTLSYNHYAKTQKTALVGHSDNTGAQDEGKLHVTFHHNFFDGTATRTPRVRFGYAHVYNNYFDFTTHAFRIGPGGEIYAEANYVASTEGKILRASENDGALTWTTSNQWDKGAFGDIGADKLDANQQVKKPPYNDSVDGASSSPPNAGSGKL